MKTFVVAFAISTAALSQGASACNPVTPDEAMAREASAIFVGTAMSTRCSYDVPHLRVTVRVNEALRGIAPTEISATSPCALPIREGERVVVVVFKQGYRAVYPSDLAEEALRAGMVAGR